MSLSIVIPTYGRESVLCETIAQLLVLAAPADEILVVDQTTDHRPPTTDHLTGWHDTGAIRWIKHAPPGTVGAMNRGLLEAKGDLVLFLDDDIIPGEELVAAHRQAHTEHAEAWAAVGQVLQPEDVWPSAAGHERAEGGKLKPDGGDAWETRTEGGSPESGAAGVSDSPPSAFRSHPSSLSQDLGFAFNGTRPAWVSNVMAGNLCVKREQALAVGGFDANFTPPVAYRFETEFAKRLVAAGGRIWFEPRASIRHLRAARGGTRSQGSHLSSASPVHGVGDYYFALRCGRGWERAWYMVRRPFREVRTRFHLRHPWFIPVKLLGEMRAMVLALKLYRQEPRLLR